MRFSFNREIKIGNTIISDNSPCFIIGEAGVNHNGDMRLARDLVRVAAEAGVNAIKFQSFKTEHLILEKVKKAPYQNRTTRSGESQYEMLKRLEINHEQTALLKAYAESLGLIFLTTPFDFASLSDLRKLNLHAIKISSTDVTNLPFLEKAAGQGLPIILSTGMSYLNEVTQALQILHEINRDVLLLHCTANYPMPIHEANLNVLNTFRNNYDMLLGYSDHSQGTGASPYAVAMGAKIIEKHFTLDQEMKGPDHKASLNPDQLKSLVQEIRNVELYLGEKEKKPTESEQETRKSLQKCIVASRVIKKQEVFTRENLTTKRTGGVGIPAIEYFRMVGKVSRFNYNKDDIIQQQ